eukprot:snap_masked-scaffold_5-processed-gene-11.25-mRNA-1 protein AED:1.00 eAED:1.00 QI:0/-1/0/0/-1/1/1/0/73
MNHFEFNEEYRTSCARPEYCRNCCTVVTEQEGVKTIGQGSLCDKHTTAEHEHNPTRTNKSNSENVMENSLQLE